MAERRMFSKSVVDDDNFSQLSKDARLLYFYLGLAADDDGFVSSCRKVMLNADVGKESLEELVETNFVIKFESNVILIKHWRQNNQIRGDRYHKTVHQKEMESVVYDEISKTYELKGCQMVAKWLPDGKPRLDKISIDKEREEKISLVETSVGESREVISPFNNAYDCPF